MPVKETDVHLFDDLVEFNPLHFGKQKASKFECGHEELTFAEVLKVKLSIRDCETVRCDNG